MKPPFRLVPDALSHETVAALESLLADAKAGKLIGIAFAGMYRQREFIVNTAGEAYRNPVFARGMVSYLHDQLGNMG